MVEIVQFGLRRTGTNLLKWLLVTNYDVEVQRRRRLGHPNREWKHGSMGEITAGKSFVVTTRHILPWLTSCWILRKQHQARRMDDTLGQFLLDRRSWIGDRPPGCPMINRWNFAYGYWLWKGIPIIHFEELVVEPEATCDAIAGRLGFRRKPGAFCIPTMCVGPIARHCKRAAVVADVRSRVWLREWGQAELRFVKDQTDPAVLAGLGYEWPPEMPE